MQAAAGPVSIGDRQGGLSSISSCRPPLRLDFIRQTLLDQGLDSNVTSFIIHCIRKSTLSQYERVWKHFCNYLRINKVSFIDDNIILRFFHHLLIDRKLKVSTLIAYKSALIDPLHYGFKYNVNNTLVHKLLKGMALTYPNQPVRSPDWSLNKVLLFIHNNVDNNNIYFNAQKSLFLLSIALGSRISEIFALRRGQNFFKKLSNGSLRIYSDPSFLAKNEKPLNRKGPAFIAPFNGPTCDSSICPVKTVEKYLVLTRRSTENSLFVHPKTLRKWSIAGMRLAIIRFIRKSQPECFPRVHDLQKYATSLAFFNDMIIDDINKSVGWRSAHIFVRHYLQNIERLRFSVSSLNTSIIRI